MHCPIATSTGTTVHVPCITFRGFLLTHPRVCDSLTFMLMCACYDVNLCDRRLGQAAKASKIARKDLFLMSMVPYHLLGYNNTIAAVEASLAQMELDYLDLARYS